MRKVLYVYNGKGKSECSALTDFFFGLWLLQLTIFAATLRSKEFLATIALLEKYYYLSYQILRILRV